MNRLHALAILGLLVAGCSSLPPRSHDAWTRVEGRRWRVVAIDGRDIIPGSEILLAFGPDGRVSGTAQNSFGAKYEVDGQSLEIEPAVATQMYFDEPEGAMDQEGRFFVVLQDVATWERADGLVLRTEDGREIELVAAD